MLTNKTGSGLSPDLSKWSVSSSYWANRHLPLSSRVVRMSSFGYLASSPTVRSPISKSSKPGDRAVPYPGRPLRCYHAAGGQSVPSPVIPRALLASVLSSCVLLGCTPLRFVDAVSENQGSRIEHIVIHFTSADFAESLRLLTERTERPVSAHYLVPETGDPTYPRRRLRVYRLVSDDQRAWHAGQSYWHGETALNSSSIGIEIVNRSACIAAVPGNRPGTAEDRCEFHDYDTEQIELVIELALDILRRHPGIDPVDIVGHADVAPDRRLDPGPKFPWRRLYEHGIGAWYDEETAQRYRERFAAQPPAITLLQRGLAAYGYDVDESGEHDARTRLALRAFQMHFRPSDWSGQPDAETAAIVFALLEKYRPRSLEALLDTSL